MQKSATINEIGTRNELALKLKSVIQERTKAQQVRKSSDSVPQKSAKQIETRKERFRRNLQKRYERK